MASPRFDVQWKLWIVIRCFRNRRKQDRFNEIGQRGINVMDETLALRDIRCTVGGLNYRIWRHGFRVLLKVSMNKANLKQAISRAKGFRCPRS